MQALSSQTKIHKMTLSEDVGLREGAADELKKKFFILPNKDQAWQDLHRLTQDEDGIVRRGAAEAIGSAFQILPNKDQAWEDLHRLTKDQDEDVRGRAAGALGSAFQHLPNKDQAWQDLHRLTQDEDGIVRRGAAGAIGSAFQHLPDKDQAWEDLHRLTQDKESYVRMYAYHSLGKASVYKATESEDINALRLYLEEAVGYFEKSAQESEYSPARFCHPFYRSYFAITFQGGSQEAVQKYLAEAKAAVGGSESKDELIKAVENLAEALREAQRLKDRPVQEVLRDLKAYEWYCTQAEKHMTSAQDKAPGTIKLMKIINPLIKEDIQTTIAEIQDIARQICQLTHDKGPGADAFCGQIKEAAGSLSGEDMTETLRSIFDFASILKEKCKLLPEDERDLVLSQLDIVDQTGAIPEKLDGIKTVVKFFLSRIQKDEEFLRRLGEMKEKMDAIHESLLGRFEISERKILSSVFERLDRDKLEIVRALLDTVQKEGVPKELIDETLNATKELISEIRFRNIDIQDTEIVRSLDSWEEAIKSPELNIENKIKVTIPIIPLLLTYEGSYNFQAGMKLDNAWTKLRGLVQR